LEQKQIFRDGRSDEKTEDSLEIRVDLELNQSSESNSRLQFATILNMGLGGQRGAAISISGPHNFVAKLNDLGQTAGKSFPGDI
jgi:hypothetical protein